jgi:hypothetical protein
MAMGTSTDLGSGSAADPGLVPAAGRARQPRLRLPRSPKVLIAWPG